MEFDRKKFDQTVSWIYEADDYYISTGMNLVPDKKYNQWIEYVKMVDPSHEIVTRIQNIEVDSLGKIRHKKKMLSLNKCYKLSELKQWMKNIARTKDEEFWLSPKYDGIAGRKTSVSNKKVLLTRGDGEYGEDISNRLDSIKYKHDGTENEWDGEILVTEDDFKEFFQPNDVNPNPVITRKNGDWYKSPRNAVSGLMRSTDPLPNRIKPITMVSYTRFRVPVTIKTIDKAIQEMIPRIQHYPIDGLVIRLADDVYGDLQGATSHHYRHSMALKNSNESGETKMRDVEFNMAKSHISLVGILDPIEIGGVTISRVTLHNTDFIKKHDIRIGDTIIIERSGDVIPNVVGVSVHAKDSKPIECTTCPSCSGKVELVGQFYKCMNDNCHDKIVNKIESACKKLGIVGISTSTVDKLVRVSDIKAIDGLFTVTQNTVEKIGMPKGSKSYTNFFDAINVVLQNPVKDSQLFAALQIEGLGESLFSKIFEKYTYKELLQHIPSGFKYITLPGVGKVRKQLLIEGLQSNVFVMDNLLRYLKVTDTKYTVQSHLPQTSSATHSYIGKKIAFSGRFSVSKSKMEAAAIKLGMMPTTTVNESLGVLVLKEFNSGSAKAEKARRLNKEIWEERQFLEFINTNGVVV